MKQNLAYLKHNYEILLAQNNHLLHNLTERIRSEIEFACKLCELHPSHAPGWEPIITETLLYLSQTPLDPSRFSEVISHAEKMLSPLANTAKSYTIYLVGHAHIDMNWMWSWPETAAVTNDTFSTVLKLMGEFPDFHFTQSQASVYKIIELYAPEMLELIRHYVHSGQWEVAASHWVEGDKNLVSGESLCRHLLYTRRYMKQLFGLNPTDIIIDWSPDTFGHPATTPTYLVQGKIRYLYLHRPGIWTQPCPPVFRWRGPDGAEVLVRNDMKLGYNGTITPQLLYHLTDFVKETGLPFMMFVYGVGDHGGGPTRRDILRALEMNQWPIFPTLVMSKSTDFFNRLAEYQDQLPVYEGELNVEFTGCYTSHSLIKRILRYGERNLLRAETAAALAWKRDLQRYPEKSLEESWQNLLLLHFHDIACGSGIRDTQTYAHGLYQNMLALTTVTETNAWRKLAQQISTQLSDNNIHFSSSTNSLSCSLGAGAGYYTREGGVSFAQVVQQDNLYPIIVFNPTSVNRKEIINVCLWDVEPSGNFLVRDSEGKFISTQVIEKGHYWGHSFIKLAFPVQVDGYGYTVYHVFSHPYQEGIVTGQARQTGRQHHCSYALSERSPEGLENEYLKLEIDPITGGILSLIYKETGETLIQTSKGHGSILEYAVERPHSMTAWSIDHTGPASYPQCQAIHRKMNGPYRARLEVEWKIKNSSFTMGYELRANDPMLYMDLKGEWIEWGNKDWGIPVLRLSLPFTFPKITTTAEIPFGSLTRHLDENIEIPTLRWIQISDSTRQASSDCLLLNDCKQGYSMEGNILKVTLLRSHYDPDPLPEIGHHQMQFALLPLSPHSSIRQIMNYATTFENKLAPVLTDIHTGKLPSKASMIQISSEELICLALKKGEEEDTLILRIYNPNPTGGSLHAHFDSDFFGKLIKVQPCNVYEQLDTIRGTVTQNRQQIHVQLAGYQLLTLKLYFKNTKQPSPE